jgi:allantoinase
MADKTYPRDLIGYGRQPPHADWPGGARIAVQVVLNYEEGGEMSVLHGDERSETFLSDMINPPALTGRHMSMEQVYEYGSRAGVWRLLRLFERYGVPVTVFGVAMAMERNPAAVEAFLRAGHEIASHGYRWINYQDAPEALEREHMARGRGPYAADRRATAGMVYWPHQPQYAAAGGGGGRVPL